MKLFVKHSNNLVDVCIVVNKLISERSAKLGN